MEIKLVKNGIFPVTRTAGGKQAEHLPDTGYTFPGTLQGEGKLAGIPVLFIRTSGCNLRCTWSTPKGNVSICDTPYASHYPGEVDIMDTGEVVDIVNHKGLEILLAFAGAACDKDFNHEGNHEVLPAIPHVGQGPVEVEKGVPDPAPRRRIDHFYGCALDSFWFFQGFTRCFAE